MLETRVTHGEGRNRVIEKWTPITFHGLECPKDSGLFSVVNIRCSENSLVGREKLCPKFDEHLLLTPN